MNNGAMTLESMSSPGKFLMFSKGKKNPTLKLHRPYDDNQIPLMLFELNPNDD